MCAAQQTVFYDHAEDRAEGAQSDDFQSLANISLPVAVSSNLLAIAYSPERQIYTVSSRNPNLRIAGNFQLGLDGGATGIGFAIHVSQSFVQVASVEGKYVLRDGYHRAFGLLAKGIHWVPVITRDYAQHDDIGFPIGLLPKSVYLGSHPPLLGDYQNSIVSADVQIPVSQKVLVVQALELGVAG